MHKMSYTVLLSKIKNIHRKARIVMILGSSIVASGDTRNSYVIPTNIIIYWLPI